MNKEKNYITPQGFKKLKDEYDHLSRTERPEITKVIQWAAGNGDRSENADYIYGKKRLREIDRRLRFLGKRLDLAVIVDPSKLNFEIIKFGATVTISDEEGSERQVQIVGVDEIDTNKGLISWKSPLGQALFNKEEGDSISVRSPNGKMEYVILSISYI